MKSLSKTNCRAYEFNHAPYFTILICRRPFYEKIILYFYSTASETEEEVPVAEADDSDVNSEMESVLFDWH